MEHCCKIFATDNKASENPSLASPPWNHFFHLFVAQQRGAGHSFLEFSFGSIGSTQKPKSARMRAAISRSSLVENLGRWLLRRCNRHRELLKLESPNDCVEEQHAAILIAEGCCHLVRASFDFSKQPVADI